MSGEVSLLPVRPAVAMGEALDGYLERVADSNGMEGPQLLRYVARGAPAAFLVLAPHADLVRGLASATGHTAGEIHAGCLASLPGLDLSGLDPADKRTWRQIAARGWAPQRGTGLCPHCVGEDGIWRIAWRHPWVTACVRHRCWLLDDCPTCEQRFASHRTPLRSVDAASGTCANPGGTRGRSCPQTLVDLATRRAPPEVLRAQERIDAAISGGNVEVLGEQTKPADYLAEVRALTVLLLHLAIQPGADSLASWAADARADAVRSAGDRSARWWLAPPDDLALRGEAIATADGILRTPELDRAADQLHPWTELTPPSNEGQLGWLADHTKPTTTLTRLLMAATSNRRRLATLLDGQPDYVLPTTAIPQVLPADLYHRHLTGMLNLTDETGRLFAALCLARRHSPATTWAEAAGVLRLPTATGIKTARACSAEITASRANYVLVLDEMARRLDPSLDYRKREDAVRRLAMRRDWYRPWARLHSPGSRATSSRYAISWLWTHHAQGHLEASPGWQRHTPLENWDNTSGGCSGPARGLYRRYIARLDRNAQEALLDIVGARATETRAAGTAGVMVAKADGC